MIEIKANVIELVGDDGAQIEMENHMEGEGRELIHETLAIVKELMANLRSESPLLHMMVIKELAADPSILRGENLDAEREKFAKMMADLTSKGMFEKGGLN